MKTTIKLILIFFAMQIAGQILGIFYAIVYSLIETGKINMDITGDVALAPSLFMGTILMTIYLWKAGYISKEKVTWSIVSPRYTILAVIMYAAVVVLIDFLLSNMEWLPNIIENTFEKLLSNWLGILSIALFGPILEELLFRGAITRALLRNYNPTTAIIISALVFGIYHMNPIQIVSASFIGFLLGWIYYKTDSIIPCMWLIIVFQYG